MFDTGLRIGYGVLDVIPRQLDHLIVGIRAGEPRQNFATVVHNHRMIIQGRA